MRRPNKGSSLKQVAYATRVMSGGAGSKKEAALLSGYTLSMAQNAKAKIEDTEGYHNAMFALAMKSNNLLLAIMSEFSARGITEFSNADLIKALNAVSGAWDRIENRRAPNALKTPEGNPLRAIFTQRVETRTAVLEQAESPAPAPTPVPAIAAEAPAAQAPIDMDF